MIVEKITESKKRNIKQFPCHSNRASSLGHPCLAFLFLQRTRWEEKTLHDTSLQYIFDMGNDIEDIVYKELNAAGFHVIEQQRAFNNKELNITGHTDGFVLINGEVFPLEIKSCSPFVFNSLSDVNSMKNHKSYYIRGYLTQINIYMYMAEKEEGVFLFKNKSSGQYKEIWVNRDDSLCEEILEKAKTINEAVKNNKSPECIEYDPRICGECGFKHLCSNSPKKASHQFINDSEMEELLNEYDKLAPSVKRFKEIDDVLKKKLKEKNDIVIGDFLVTGTYRETTYYAVPLEIKRQYSESRKNWFKKIVRI